MIAAQIWVRRRRILRPAAGLDLTGIEACLDGSSLPTIKVLRGGFRCYDRVLRGFCVTSADKNER